MSLGNDSVFALKSEKVETAFDYEVRWYDQEEN